MFLLFLYCLQGFIIFLLEGAVDGAFVYELHESRLNTSLYQGSVWVVELR